MIRRKRLTRPSLEATAWQAQTPYNWALDVFVVTNWMRKQAGSPFAAQPGSLCSVQPTPCGTTSFKCFTFSGAVS